MSDVEPVLVRTANERAVMQTLLAGPAITRSQLARATGLSKPTVHGIVGTFVSEGLVESVGQRGGTVGRSATLFRPNPLARSAIGVDLGGTKVLAAVADLTGHIRAERRIRTDSAVSGVELIGRLAELCRGLAEEAGIPWDTVGAIAIGSPGVADPLTGRMEFAANIPALADTDLGQELALALDKPVFLENDVNMALIGERWQGLAQQSTDAVFVSLGTGLGMGVLSGGQLHRGATGAAGEIGYLPLGSDPFDTNVQALGPLEEVLSARGVVANYERQRVHSSDPPLDNAQGIFEAATSLTNEAASRTVAATAHYLAMAISAVQAVLDPDRVILGGGIGANPLLLREVRLRLAGLARRPSSVDISALGERAALVGAVSESLRIIQEQLLQNPNPSPNVAQIEV